MKLKTRAALPGASGAFFLLLTLWAVCGACDPGPREPADDRRAEDGGGEQAEEHDPWEIQLGPEQVREAGLRTTQAAPQVLDVVLTATAVVGNNLDTQAHVTPRLGGLVREIHGHLGQRVQAGDPLCEIDSVDLGVAASEALDADAKWRAADRALERERELLARTVEIAETIYEREKDLSEREISTLRPFYAAEQALQEARTQRDRRTIELETQLEQARIRRDGALRRLRILGVDPEDLIDAERSEAARAGRYRIEAPRDGVIVERDITLDEYVDAEDVVYRIQDLKRAWVLASVYEGDLTRVRIGAPARVRLNAFPDQVIEGEVAYIDYHVDRTSRAASVRVEVDNLDLPVWQEPFPVRPGMFGMVEITVSTRPAAVVIPELAVVHEDDGLRVFVARGNGLFEGRRVRVSDTVGGLVEVLEGVASGEEVVVSGTFLLKSRARSEELGGE